MGGNNKSVTVGYRYSLGAHLALCHGPIDAIREIMVDGRVAWSAATNGGNGSGGFSGGGSGTATRIGALGAVVAEPALAGDLGASLRFTGTLAGMRIGHDYRLVLANGASHEISLLAVAYDAPSNTTRWTITPATLAFTAPSAVVFTATTPEGRAGAGGGRIRIDKHDLFGGEGREGGIVGNIDVLMGGPAQAANDYLAAQIGGAIPAYRGLCSLVLRQVYVGINPYIKPWAIRATRVLTGEAGAKQWYPERAAIVPEASISDAAIYIALDASGSMYGARMAAQKAGVAALIREIGASVDPDLPNDIRIVLWNTVTFGSIERRNVTAAGYKELETWMLAQISPIFGGTRFDAAFTEAAAFFAGSNAKRRVIVFVTDGEPTPIASVDAALAIIRTLPPVDIFGFNIAVADTSHTARIDNTAVDGVPVVPAGDASALTASLRGAFGNGPDMNPAHIIRECLTNRDWGLGYPSADMGESFTAAADALYLEGFGLSLIWQQDSSIEDFISSILDHIDATLYVDRRSGLWQLKLIRADYVASDLPLFDETNVVDWGRLGRRAQADLVNSVTVRYTDAQTSQGVEKTAAVSISDTARVQAMGEVLAATLSYPGIRSQNLALRVAERDLRALSTPILSGEITVNRQGAGLSPGDAIRLSSPRMGLDNVIMRVSEIGQGDGRAGGIRLKIAEDVFALGASSIAGGRVSAIRGVAAPPKAMARRLVCEAPYWLLVRELGHADADQRLATDPSLGSVLATGERPSGDAMAAEIWLDHGAGPINAGTAAFAPSAVLAAALSDDPEDRTVAVTGWQDSDDVAIGSLAAIGFNGADSGADTIEWVRVDGIGPSHITLGRGCLDTPPRAHAAGSPIVFWDEVATITSQTFAAGEEVSARLLPQTGRGTLAHALAPEDIITFNRRAIRPLPPARLQGNGSYAPPRDALIAAPLQLTWAHRDRLTQTSPVIADYTAASIGPEPGVQYQVEIAWVDPDTGLRVAGGPALSFNVGTGGSFALQGDDIPEAGAPDRTAEIDITVRARRNVDGLWLSDLQSRHLRQTAPFAVGWDRSWGMFWGN